MQTAARLDFIGLPRLRGCGGSVFLCWKERIWGRSCGLWGRGWVWCAAVDCVGEVWFGARVWFVSTRFGLACGWIVGAKFGLARGCGLFRRGWVWCEAVDCVGEVGLGTRLWIVGARVGLGARRGLWGRELGLALGCGLCRRGWAWCEAVNCVDEVGFGARLDCGGGRTVMRRYRNCVKRRIFKKRFSFLLIFAIGK